MSDEERSRILRMVAEGKLSPEEAAELLEAVQDVERKANAAASPASGPGGPIPPTPPSPPPPVRPIAQRAVVIHIREGGENKVNLRIPLTLARMAGRFIPRQAQQYLASYEIDLQAFLDDAGNAQSGTLLEVKEGDNRVLIAVE